MAKTGESGGMPLVALLPVCRNCLSGGILDLWSHMGSRDGVVQPTSFLLHFREHRTTILPAVSSD